MCAIVVWKHFDIESIKDSGLIKTSRQWSSELCCGLMVCFQVCWVWNRKCLRPPRWTSWPAACISKQPRLCFTLKSANFITSAMMKPSQSQCGSFPFASCPYSPCSHLTWSCGKEVFQLPSLLFWSDHSVSCSPHSPQLSLPRPCQTI